MPDAVCVRVCVVGREVIRGIALGSGGFTAETEGTKGRSDRIREALLESPRAASASWHRDLGTLTLTSTNYPRLWTNVNGTGKVVVGHRHF